MPSVSKAAAAALSGSPPQTEKPTHYRYLKEFRTEQCSLFLQHKCSQHRPFTCFHWHFLNQRRRRPLRRRDGTFNYSPDVYCSKYDEATGLCPDGDECPYLHRTTGDTERKYHLRYYKTGTCIHETDARGHCVKNGLHCAFAHGPLDLRPPVCDIRELQAQEALQNGQLSGGDGVPDLQPGVLASQAMIEKILGEDPRWQDSNFVLGSYKTEQCPKPPRLCRQGYACPHYHNSRDRRRNPRRFQYRSTPCPSVKHGDEWGEPSRCDVGDSCQYCHSRTEQQFHPEIYKSTKCNDMRQTGYCPRGPFCAFAHIEKSLGMVNEWSCRDLSSNSTSAYSSQPGSAKRKDSPSEGSQKATEDSKQNHLAVFSVVHPLAPSISSSVASSLASSTGSGSSSPTTLPNLPARALPLDPAGNTVEAVIGSALDLRLSDINIASLDKDLEEQDLGLTGLNGVPGSIWDFVSGSFSPSPSPILNSGPSASSSASPNSAELARVRRQLDEAKRKIRQWEESWQQVKQACDAWQREAQEAKERARVADSDRQLALQRKEEVEAQVKQLQEELEGLGLSSLPGLRSLGDISDIPLPKLHSLQSQLRLDLEAVDGVIFQLRAKQCVACQERAHGTVLRPCQHRVLCEPCAASTPECPYCKGQPLPW
ncbi:putative E3 ubiquitin-protein ligase UNKL isoform X4 [Rattus norvegicus]|uniref:unk like zinc finger isoform 2 n=2 Tax=Rattus norvegicus TaxID=10116 RepID=UPI0003D06F9E|nr:putative E3 ubiquitin-protein ligase UNKL isoform X4 [Rattus norvegicus]|eukprot:XP_008765831.1 PREDICTED: putative E3 ubiquitin-protein ligase UNKL isoform X4 [Rattus norvegicus]